MMMIKKKLFFIHKMQTVFYFLLSICCTPLTYSEDSEQDDSTVWENPFKKDKVDRAIEKGIQFLLKKQQDDGSINDKGKKTAMTALSLMSMASVGHQPIHPNEFGRAMQNALDFILLDENQDDRGYFGNKDGGRMYGHGIVTLMLSEMLGMGMNKETDKKIRDQCQEAINLILKAQKVKKNPAQQGGWRYSPDARDADLSVSVWQLMALRSAKNSGLDVPSSAISNAVSYLERSYKSKLLSNGDPAEKKSGFAYQPGGAAEYTTSAAGLLAMQVCGEYESPFVHGAANWLLDHKPEKSRKFFFYGTYYYAQGMYQHGGDHAHKARELVENILLELQRENGSWIGSGSEAGAGEVYSTTLAILALAVKYHYLPIYQR